MIEDMVVLFPQLSKSNYSSINASDMDRSIVLSWDTYEPCM